MFHCFRLMPSLGNARVFLGAPSRRFPRQIANRRPFQFASKCTPRLHASFLCSLLEIRWVSRAIPHTTLCRVVLVFTTMQDVSCWTATARLRRGRRRLRRGRRRLRIRGARVFLGAPSRRFPRGIANRRPFQSASKCTPRLNARVLRSLLEIRWVSPAILHTTLGRVVPVFTTRHDVSCWTATACRLRCLCRLRGAQLLLLLLGVSGLVHARDSLDQCQGEDELGGAHHFVSLLSCPSSSCARVRWGCA